MLGFLKRRNLKSFLINADFQWDVIIKITGLAFVNLVFLWFTVQGLFWSFGEHGKKLNIAPGSAYFVFLDMQYSLMNKVFLCVGVFNLLLLFVGGVVLSHKIAGPLYRLRSHMDGISSGKIKGHVKFRTGDYFPELADSFNRQLDYTSRNHGHDKSNHHHHGEGEKPKHKAG